MRVLIACEFSGVVRRAFQARGHETYSCDLLPAEDGEKDYHLQCDIHNVLKADMWDLMIAHPPCTYLCVSGLHRNKDNPKRAKQTEDALQFVRDLLYAPIARMAIENPVGCISTRIRKPNQIIQPYQFGHDASKRTCLWLQGLLPLQATSYVPPRIFVAENGKSYPRWGNQTDSGQNKLGPSEDRWKLRSVTYQGIAEAMATQWG